MILHLNKNPPFSKFTQEYFVPSLKESGSAIIEAKKYFMKVLQINEIRANLNQKGPLELSA